MLGLVGVIGVHQNCNYEVWLVTASGSVGFAHTVAIDCRQRLRPEPVLPWPKPRWWQN